MKTGARTLIEALQREGVDTIFGYPGGVVLPNMVSTPSRCSASIRVLAPVFMLFPE